MSLLSFLDSHPAPQDHQKIDTESLNHHPDPNRPSISGPSLYTFERRTPDWSITESDVYRTASPIPYPLIEHPDLEKGFQRPKEWGEKTPDLIEAEAISEQMRKIDQLRRERLERIDRLRAVRFGKLPRVQREEVEESKRHRGDSPGGSVFD
jgi:hypothetical protein